MTRMMVEGHTVDVIYFDCAKAFDSVNQKHLLLAKVKSFGLIDAVVRKIEAYVSGWVSRVHISGEHDCWLTETLNWTTLYRGFLEVYPPPPPSPLP